MKKKKPIHLLSVLELAEVVLTVNEIKVMFGLTIYVILQFGALYFDIFY